MARSLALAYHAVTDEWPNALAISPALFGEHVRRLAERGFRGVTLSQLAGGVAYDAVAITFDDGFASVATAAKPILDELGWPATVYLVTDTVGSETAMRHLGGDDDSYAAERRPLSWDAVRDLAAAGWEIGSHTRTHRVLSTLADAEVAAELGGSREAVIAEVGECRSISYPLGAIDDRVLAAARAAGYTSGSGLAGRFRLRDPLAVPRVAIAGGDRRARFGVKTSHGFRLARATPLWTWADHLRGGRRSVGA